MSYLTIDALTKEGKADKVKKSTKLKNMSILAYSKLGIEFVKSIEIVVSSFHLHSAIKTCFQLVNMKNTHKRKNFVVLWYAISYLF